MMKLSLTDRAAVLFTGTQKTIALGLPLADSYFRGTAVPVGIVILPLVFYHLLQLTVGSLLIPRVSRRIEQEAARPDACR